MFRNDKENLRSIGLTDIIFIVHNSIKIFLIFTESSFKYLKLTFKIHSNVTSPVMFFSFCYMIVCAWSIVNWPVSNNKTIYILFIFKPHELEVFTYTF